MGLLGAIVKKARIFIKKYSYSPYGWKGNYPGWKAAMQDCNGYNAGNILEKVKNATFLANQSNDSLYERDSVLFDKPEYSFPLLSYLLLAEISSPKNLNVIDFGGSLGSSYRQYQLFLKRLENVRWNVVEQADFVAAGNKYFSDENLKFFPSIDACVSHEGKPDILVISCTLPYLEYPYQILNEIINHKIRYIVIDNTPFNFVDKDRITVQKVNPLIYEASYPCWFLSYEKVKKQICEHYSILAEHMNESVIYLDGRAIRYQGFLAELKATK